VNETLLIVDDDASLSDLYRLELEDEGYRVLTAHSGPEALRALEGQHADLVVLDIRMEGMDGLDTLAEILKVRREMPVILNSAYSNFKTDFGAWNADAYVVKSANLEELKSRIRDVLLRRAKARAA